MGKCLLEDNVSIGSNSTISNKNLFENVIGAGSVVVKDIKVKGIYADSKINKENQNVNKIS